MKCWYKNGAYILVQCGAYIPLSRNINNIRLSNSITRFSMFRDMVLSIYRYLFLPKKNRFFFLFGEFGWD